MSHSRTTDFTPWFIDLTTHHFKSRISSLFLELDQQLQMFQKDFKPEQPNELPLEFIEYHVEKCFDTLKKNILRELKQYPKTKFTIKHRYPLIAPVMLNSRNDLLQMAKLSTASPYFSALPQLAFLDLETDGLNIETANILQIAIIKPIINPDHETLHYVKTWSKYILPYKGYKQVDNKAYNINHIGDKELATAIPIEETSYFISNALKETAIIGYNCNSFDIPILKRHLEANKTKLLHKFSIDLYPACWKNKKQTQADAMKAYNLKENPNPHDALSDANCCMDLLAKLLEYNELPNNEEEILDFSASSKNTWHNKKVVEINQSFILHHDLMDETSTTLKRRYSELSSSISSEPSIRRRIF
jgi:DNA polymerase III epsilon subunit-like protein